MNESKGKRTAWMMAVCCGLPAAALLIAAAGGWSLGAKPWTTAALIAVMAAGHFVMLKGMGGATQGERGCCGGHGGKAAHPAEEPSSAGPENGKAAKEAAHGCCHK